MINYRHLTKTDLSQVIAFYKDTCDHQQFDQYSPDWTWGVYPSEQSLKKASTTCSSAPLMTMVRYWGPGS